MTLFQAYPDLLQRQHPLMWLLQPDPAGDAASDVVSLLTAKRQSLKRLCEDLYDESYDDLYDESYDDL